MAVFGLALVQPSFAVQASPDTLLAQGHQAYEAGQLQQAKQRWQQAAHSYDQGHQPVEAALSLSYLALSYQELGQWQQAEQAIQQSLTLLEKNGSPAEVLARVLNTQGSIQLALGQPAAALATWEKATEYYQALDDQVGQIGSQLNQAQAMQTLGFYRRAQTLLDQLATAVEAQSDSSLKATTLRSLGSLLQVTGHLEQSQTLLEQSLAITETLEQPAETAKTLFALANTLRARNQPDQALKIYHQLMASTTSPQGHLETQLNLLSLLVTLQRWDEAEPLLTSLGQELPNLQASRSAIYSRVNFTESALTFNQARSPGLSPIAIHDLADLLAQGAQQAKALQDPRAESLALGQLGQLYVTTQQWQQAREVTQQAIRLANHGQAKDIGYRWQWQLGKIYQQQNQKGRAIATYTEAVNTLASVRADLLATSSELQFSIREKVEPLYRELVSLLLESDTADQKALKQSLNLIEDLQLVELENYFRSACIDTQSKQIDQIDPQAAVIYPIILADRIEVVLALPNQPLSHYRTTLPKTELENTLDQFFIAFNPALPDRRRLQFSKQLYDWLIRPAEAQLTQHHIKTLVFVLDGKLRNIPMAALHDGEKYLIENYGVALTPGLELMGPHFSPAKPLEALILGVSESRQGFSPLPGVKEEVERISSNLQKSQVYLDQAFTKQAFEAQVKATPYPILHLATHGQFSSDLASTFLLAWDQTIALADLDTLLKDRRIQARHPIELMVLSACQTAEGDDRATLGLAGMAIKSGARSTLATLWSVNDHSTVQLINNFYSVLGTPNVSITKAEALRQAQLSMLKTSNYSHPFYWASFVLIGNWLT
ncbi:CHAT domain-containing protein [Leptothoe sp. PORK10 BA2]|uniref:CHAT domain-containing protein n=1 Tax=Leptothoe sp. PORK10 BA2 TaxID=3110254 RepID=UPI002B2006BD|nr:CHAT domain-containing protein [Leptothoe sp. PORK10 BA2]MEA5466756.1 CHAT domain-containing protein [Leptothoe sp. PORK10 BA2]